MTDLSTEQLKALLYSIQRYAAEPADFLISFARNAELKEEKTALGERLEEVFDKILTVELVVFLAQRVSFFYSNVFAACGTALTACAALLLALINPNAVYWAFGFPSAIIAVVGADFVFACGTMYVAKKCLPHEQSVGGAVFQTMTQLGTALGVTVSTVVFDRVLESREVDDGFNVDNSTASTEPQWLTFPAYKAAMWTCFAFGMCACFLTIFLRVGVIEHGDATSAGVPEDVTRGAKNSGRGSTDKASGGSIM
ncbi:hypothetical protein BDP27DRAFT_1441720 [Rhodocollybia butyracea]|uniref:Uncharacterized protein n=1 Tax=Rhodocollybia butyracea TaxID=206335 RepID=A0A9P5UGN7_9AGAR|nr:hypothetical protein BDP27DRAFT_1441720 [Rhodocollybia butyracea]